MALERKDIRAKLDPDMHADLVDLCEVEGIELGEFVEREVIAAIERRVHAATLIVERRARRGKSGNRRESIPEGAPRELPFARRSET